MLVPNDRNDAGYVDIRQGMCAGAAAETDRNAIETLQEAYGPDYKVVGVKSREVLLNAGNIHCITQQWVKAG